MDEKINIHPKPRRKVKNWMPWLLYGLNPEYEDEEESKCNTAQ